MAAEIEIRIAHSQSSPNKVWLTLTENDDEYAVAFDKHDINKILQVNDVYYDELTEEEASDPRIREATTALAMACYYPTQFVQDPENTEVIAYIEDLPSSYVTARHVDRILETASDVTQWKVYPLIQPSQSAPSTKKPNFRRVQDEEPVDEEESYEEEEEHFDDEPQYESEEEDSE